MQGSRLTVREVRFDTSKGFCISTSLFGCENSYSYSINDENQTWNSCYLQLQSLLKLNTCVVGMAKGRYTVQYPKLILVSIQDLGS